MDTTNTAPKPPTPPTPTPPRSTVTGWWRRPLADLLDVAVVALAGLLVGGGVAAALLADASDDAWAELGAVLLGVGAGVVAAVATWVWVLVVIASRGTSPGSRAVGLAATRPLAAAGRHLAVVVVLWAALLIATAATEPWPAGPLAGAFGAAVATAATRGAWGSGPWRTHWRTVGIAAVVGLLLTGAVPDRAPYPWELRRDAEEAIVAALVDDPAAQRVSDLVATEVVGGHAVRRR